MEQAVHVHVERKVEAMLIGTGVLGGGTAIKGLEGWSVAYQELQRELGQAMKDIIVAPPTAGRPQHNSPTRFGSHWLRLAFTPESSSPFSGTWTAPVDCDAQWVSLCVLGVLAHDLNWVAAFGTCSVLQSAQHAERTSAREQPGALAGSSDAKAPAAGAARTTLESGTQITSLYVNPKSHVYELTMSFAKDLFALNVLPRPDSEAATWHSGITCQHIISVLLPLVFPHTYGSRQDSVSPAKHFPANAEAPLRQLWQKARKREDAEGGGIFDHLVFDSHGKQMLAKPDTDRGARIVQAWVEGGGEGGSTEHLATVRQKHLDELMQDVKVAAPITLPAEEGWRTTGVTIRTAEELRETVQAGFLRIFTGGPKVADVIVVEKEQPVGSSRPERRARGRLGGTEPLDGAAAQKRSAEAQAQKREGKQQDSEAKPAVKEVKKKEVKKKEATAGIELPTGSLRGDETGLLFGPGQHAFAKGCIWASVPAQYPAAIVVQTLMRGPRGPVLGLVAVQPGTREEFGVGDTELKFLVNAGDIDCLLLGFVTVSARDLLEAEPQEMLSATFAVLNLEEAEQYQKLLPRDFGFPGSSTPPDTEASSFRSGMAVAERVVSWAFWVRQEVRDHMLARAEAGSDFSRVPDGYAEGEESIQELVPASRLQVVLVLALLDMLEETRSVSRSARCRAMARDLLEQGGVCWGRFMLEVTVERTSLATSGWDWMRKSLAACESLAAPGSKRKVPETAQHTVMVLTSTVGSGGLVGGDECVKNALLAILQEGGNFPGMQGGVPSWARGCAITVRGEFGERADRAVMELMATATDVDTAAIVKNLVMDWDEESKHVFMEEVSVLQQATRGNGWEEVQQVAKAFDQIWVVGADKAHKGKGEAEEDATNMGAAALVSEHGWDLVVELCRTRAADRDAAVESGIKPAVLLNICRVRALRAAVKEGTVKKVRRRQVDKDAVTLADSVHVLAVMLHSGQKQMRTVHDRQVEAHRLAHEGMSEWLKFPEASSPEDNTDSTSQVHCAQAEPSHGGSGQPVHGGDSAGS